MFSGKKWTDACRFGISSPPVTGEKYVSPAFRRIWSVCSSPFLCEKCLCETWCQFITLPVLDSSCCMVSFGCITRTLMLRSPCAQQVKSSKLAWPGWWGSMLPGYVDGVRRFSQGAWEDGRRERWRGESGRTEGRCDQQERKRRVGGKINVQRGGCRHNQEKKCACEHLTRSNSQKKKERKKHAMSSEWSQEARENSFKRNILEVILKK